MKYSKDEFFIFLLSAEEKQKFEGTFEVPFCSLNNIDTTKEKIERIYSKKVQKIRILKKKTKYPKIITKNKTIIDKWYPDNCDQTATLKLQLHKRVFACLSSVPAVSDRIKDVIVLFNISESTLLHSWIRESFPDEDL